MALLNGSLANALGRPDAMFASQRGVVGAPPVVVGGTASAAVADAGSLTGNGRGALIALIGLVVLYSGGAVWLRHHLA